MNTWPKIHFPSATEIVEPRALGYGVQYFVLSSVSKSDYEEYKEYLRREGFEELDSFLTVSSVPTDISMFRRGKQHVALRHVPDKKTWMSFFEDDVTPYCLIDILKELPSFEYDSVESAEEGYYAFCLKEKEQEAYESFLCELGANGFLKYAENQIGLDVSTAIYQKDRCAVSVIYLKRTKKLYIQAGFDRPLSKHLLNEETHLEGMDARRKTTLAMLQMTRLGSSFVIQLKNGNFIVNDGGIGCELEQLLRYMELHTEEGKKPHVEAWVLSHVHNDHVAVLTMIAENPEYAQRVDVDGIYLNIPSKLKRTLDPGESNYQILGVKDASKLLGAPIYRLQTGQRYYFCDITLDVLLSTEQVPMETHSNDINDTSTWCLYTIEGQHVMLAGDADRGSCKVFSEIYTKGYWTFDVFSAFHHGSNTSDVVTEHCQFRTILVPRVEEPWKHVEENLRLKAKSKEWFLKGEGTRILEFPYQVGKSKIMKEFDQTYDKMKIENAVRKYSGLMKEAHDYIWTNPETGYREWKTSAYLEKAFEELGYELIKAGDIPGFYTILDTGKPGPEVLVLGEMDSLICKEHPEADPETGAVHCCGHSMQSATLLGIAAAMKERGMIEKLCGRIRFCAVPAEELIEIEYRTQLRNEGVIRYMGGKTEFLYRGYFDGVDMAFMIHTTVAKEPCARLGSVGCLSKRVIYKGVSAHAGGSPWNGRNALYAANLGLSAINSIRETFQEKDLIRVHPIITQGGDVVNAIPDRVVVESYVRGKTLDAIKHANKRVNRALCGAALALGTHIEIEDVPGYTPLNNQMDLIKLVAEAVETITDYKFDFAPVFGTGSTDMGDLSVLIPSVHPYMPGAVGMGHGANYTFPDAEKACMDSAMVQLYLLHLLLKDDAINAKGIIANFKSEFASKEEFFKYIDSFERKGERITYTDEESVLVEL